MTKNRQRFNNTNWPRGLEFTDQEIGVTNLPAYTRFPELFDGARWICTQNLVIDNVVIARKTVLGSLHHRSRLARKGRPQ